MGTNLPQALIEFAVKGAAGDAEFDHDPVGQTAQAVAAGDDEKRPPGAVVGLRFTVVGAQGLDGVVEAGFKRQPPANVGGRRGVGRC